MNDDLRENQSLEGLTRKRLSDLADMLREWAKQRKPVLSVGERHILEDAASGCEMALRLDIELAQCKRDMKGFLSGLSEQADE